MIMLNDIFILMIFRIEIYNRVVYCLENKNKIIDLYNKWKKENDKLSKASVKKFLEG